MALADKKYTELYESTKKTNIESVHSEGLLSHMIDNPEDDPHLTSVLKEIKDLQEELDALRTEISANKDKTGITTSQANAITANTAKVSFPGLGTTSSTALAGDTTTISIAQAREITANTAKTSMTLGTSSTTALAGDTNIVTIGSSTTIAFGDMVTVPAKGKTPASYNIVMTVTNGGVSKSITLTLT